MPNKKWIYACIGIQLAVLAGMVVQSVYPLVLGTPIKLEVRPRDPRDLLRGQYVRLIYDFTSMQLEGLPNDLANGNRYRYGDILFLTLKTQKGLCVPAGLWQKRPQKENGLPVIKLLVEHPFTVDTVDNMKTAYLKAGIESYFATPEDAQAIEDAMRTASWREMEQRNNENGIPMDYRVIATVYVAADGTPRISGLTYPKSEK